MLQLCCSRWDCCLPATMFIGLAPLSIVVTILITSRIFRIARLCQGPDMDLLKVLARIVGSELIYLNGGCPLTPTKRFAFLLSIKESRLRHGGFP